MKLLRIGQPGAERAAVLADDGVSAFDVSGLVGDFTPDTLTGDINVRLVDFANQPRISLDGERIGSPVVRPGTIWCIGLNYIDHAREADMPIPGEPIVFSKAVSSLSGPNDAIPFRSDMTKLDWEVELGLVVGRSTYQVTEEDALAHLLGYTIVNDVSERAWQIERNGQWMKGKSHPGFCPAGPWLVTRDEVPDPQALRLWLDVNGERRQDGTTGDMIFSVAKLVSYLSSFARLEPGDLICTGTPAGVGAGLKPPVFLSRGDTLRLGIDGLGEQATVVKAA